MNQSRLQAILACLLFISNLQSSSWGMSTVAPSTLRPAAGAAARPLAPALRSFCGLLESRNITHPLLDQLKAIDADSVEAPRLSAQLVARISEDAFKRDDAAEICFLSGGLENVKAALASHLSPEDEDFARLEAVGKQASFRIAAIRITRLLSEMSLALANLPEIERERRKSDGVPLGEAIKGALRQLEEMHLAVTPFDPRKLQKVIDTVGEAAKPLADAGFEAVADVGRMHLALNPYDPAKLRNVVDTVGEAAKPLADAGLGAVADVGRMHLALSPYDPAKISNLVGTMGEAAKPLADAGLGAVAEVVRISALVGPLGMIDALSIPVDFFVGLLEFVYDPKLPRGRRSQFLKWLDQKTGLPGRLFKTG